MKKLIFVLLLTPLTVFSQFIKVEDFVLKPDWKEIKAGMQAMDARIEVNREKVSFYLDNIIEYNNQRTTKKDFFTLSQTDYIIDKIKWAKKNYYNVQIISSNQNANTVITELKKLYAEMQGFKCSTDCYSVTLD